MLQITEYDAKLRVVSQQLVDSYSEVETKPDHFYLAREVIQDSFGEYEVGDIDNAWSTAQ